MKIILVALFMTSVAYAQISKVNIKNFNFKYQAPMGEGTAEAFSYEQKYNESQAVEVEKIGEEFKILLQGVENRELAFKNAPDFIKHAQDINLSTFNLLFADKFAFSTASAHFNSPDKNIDLKNMNLACDRLTNFSEVIDQLISGCVQKMSLKTSGISTDGESGLDQAFINALDEGHDAILGNVAIKNLNLKVIAGKFDLSADLKAQISGTAKAFGILKYETALKKLTIKVSEVKFGILDVTSKVFEELKKQESTSMKVSKPYIYLTIK